MMSANDQRSSLHERVERAAETALKMHGTERLDARAGVRTKIDTVLAKWSSANA